MKEEVAAVTKMQITLELGAGDSIESVVEGLPGYCRESFAPLPNLRNCWRGDFEISCRVAPELAEGDLIDDFAPYLRELLLLKDLYNARYELFVAVGDPAPDRFQLGSHTVALLAALGAKIVVVQNRNGSAL
jgi:hypothetical protein